MVKVSSITTIEVYPDMSFPNYLAQKLGSQYVSFWGDVYLLGEKRRFKPNFLNLKKLIADVQVIYGTADDSNSYDQKIVVSVSDPEYLKTIEEIAESYESEYASKLESKRHEYTYVKGSVSIEVEYRRTDSTKKRKKSD